MRKLLISILLSLTFALCSCGSVQNQVERERRWRRTTNLQLREMVDDFDTIWLLDQNSRLTEYHVDTKY